MGADQGPLFFPTSAMDVQVLQATSFEGSLKVLSSELSHNIHLLLGFCVCVYGTIAVLWASYYALMKHDVKGSPVYVGLLCLTWCSMSVGMHVTNKSLATELASPFLIITVQMLFGLLAMIPSCYAQFKNVSSHQLIAWLVVPGFFAGMLATGFFAYEYISLSLLTVVRNLGPLVVLPVEIFFMPPEKRPVINLRVTVSLLLTLAGGVFYCGGLGSISYLGVFFAFLQLFIASTDRLLQRRLLVMECKGMPIEMCAAMNNGFGMFLTAALAYGTGEVGRAVTAEGALKWSNPEMILLLGISSLIGIGICYFGFACQREISATSFTVLQNLSKVFVVNMGVLFFDDAFKSPLLLVGLCLSIGGSVLYGQAQYEARNSEAKPLLPEVMKKRINKT